VTQLSRTAAVRRRTATSPGVVRERRLGDGARGRVSQILVVAAAVLLWHVFSLSDMAVKANMPAPLETAGRFLELLPTPEFWTTIGSTMLSWCTALLLSLVIGIPVGMGLGRHRVAGQSSKFVIDFLRTIPSLAIIPLALLLLGPNYAMVVMVAAFTAVWPVLIQSMYAAENADPSLGLVGRSYRLTRRDRIRYILAPQFLSFFWPGLRMAVTASLLVAVGAELIGGAPGIGSAIQNSLLFNEQVTMFAYVLAAAGIGLGINSVLMLLQRKLLWWHASMRKAG
jgi:ABC-type nitrate/sulfonate/bicarbonate transport system permease component